MDFRNEVPPKSPTIYGLFVEVAYLGGQEC